MEKLNICNQALRLIHVGTITSLDDDSNKSPQAADCNIYYEHCLKDLLIAYDWNFAMVTLEPKKPFKDAV